MPQTVHAVHKNWIIKDSQLPKQEDQLGTLSDRFEGSTRNLWRFSWTDDQRTHLANTKYQDYILNTIYLPRGGYRRCRVLHGALKCSYRAWTKNSYGFHMVNSEATLSLWRILNNLYFHCFFSLHEVEKSSSGVIGWLLASKQGSISKVNLL